VSRRIKVLGINIIDVSEELYASSLLKINFFETSDCRKLQSEHRLHVPMLNILQNALFFVNDLGSFEPTSYFPAIYILA
jgi:hypothetical protein